MATMSAALATAVQHHQAGRLHEAEQTYLQILAVDPDHAEAVHLLGVIAIQLGRADVAVEHIRRAIELNGSNHVFHSDLGNAFKAQGMLNEAVDSFCRAIGLKPDYADGH